jgi:hypothetical protein
MNPLVFIIAFLIVVVVFQVFTDYRRARLVRRFKYEQPAEDGGLSIVIELDRSPRNLPPLLDHLSSLNGTIDVIVIVKRSAGTTAAKQIRNLRTVYPNLSIRTVMYRKGLNAKTIAKRHARQPLIMWMKPDERMEGDFIRLANRHFDNPAIQAVAVNEYVPVGSTLADASQAWRSVRMNVIRLMTNRGKQRTVIYRRRALYSELSLQIQASWLLRISHVHPATSNGLAYALLSGLVVLPLVFLHDDIMSLIIWIIVAAAACIHLSWLMSAPVYRIRDRFMLLLLLPFSLVK